MEDAGGQGSAGGHFEKRFFGDEMMVPDDTFDSRFSVMSLAIAADSGWYDVDFMGGDEYNWGKGSGCEMFMRQCPRNLISEFCNKMYQ